MTRRARCLVFAAIICAVGVASAAEPARLARLSQDLARLDGNVGEHADGRTALNLAAGVANAQANVAALAIGAGQVHSAASQEVAASVAPRDALAEIGGSVLASGRGLTSVNQAAGAANAQVNLLAVGTDASVALVQAIDVDLLAGVTAREAAPVGATANDGPVATREARIGGAAFQGPQGVLQINQTAGVGNASANAIVLQLPGGAP